MLSSAPSTPTSPSSPLLGHTAPRWLKPPRSITAPRSVFKLCLLAFVCVVLGWSVADVYDARVMRPKRVVQRPLGGSPAGNRDGNLLGDDGTELVGGGRRVGYLEEAAVGGHRGSLGSGSSKEKEKAGFDREPGGSIFGGLSEKISSFNPWIQDTNDNSPGVDDHDLVYGTNSHGTFEHFTPATAPTGDRPVIAKITIITGDNNNAYERALHTHVAHNRIHGYPMHTLRQSILNDVWSKPAYILSVMLRELAKPKAERVQWLFWVDADTIIINPHVPAEVFLPPVGFDDVHLLVSHDWNGLNNGIFPIRVHPWSVELLSAVIAFPAYHPDEDLLFRDQSAMGELLKIPKFARHTVLPPQRWFNAYQGEINETIAPFQTRPGDLLVHFAGVPDREERMEWWLRRAELHLPEWEIEFRHTSYKTETREFWEEMRRNRYGNKREALRLKHQMEERMDMMKHAKEKYDDVLTDEDKERFDKAFEKAKKMFEEDDTKENIEAIKEGLLRLKEGTSSVQKLMDKENKALVAEAHEALYSAEKLLVANEEFRETCEEFNQLEETVNHLKETLLGRLIRADMVNMEIRILREKQEVFQVKAAMLRAEKEPVMEASVDLQSSIELKEPTDLESISELEEEEPGLPALPPLPTLPDASDLLDYETVENWRKQHAATTTAITTTAVNRIHTVVKVVYGPPPAETGFS